ncbi:unnamed protein product [Ixodes persulcatus]
MAVESTECASVFHQLHRMKRKLNCSDTPQHNKADTSTSFKVPSCTAETEHISEQETTPQTLKVHASS